MTRNAYLMTFEEMRQEFTRNGLTCWAGIIAPQPDSRILITEQELNEKLKNTWWEVDWTAGVPRCRYLADSLRDALRLRPQINLTPSFRSAVHWISLLDEWYDEVNEDTEFLHGDCSASSRLAAVC